MTFKFSCRDKEGRVVKGTIEAQDGKKAVAILREQGLLVIQLTPKKENPFFLARKKIHRVSFADLVNFTRQLATMFTAGLSLIQALRILREQVENLGLRKIIEEVTLEVEAGSSFAKALERQPLFPKTYTSVVSSGEASGMLDEVLLKLADNLEKQHALRAKIKGALIYPAIILIVMGAVVFIMMVVVMPRMSRMYQEFGATLPQATQILISLSNLTAKFWWLGIVFLIFFYFLYSFWRKTPVGKRATDHFWLKFPLLGQLLKQQLLAEFSRTLGLLITAGVPILEGLGLVSEAVGNTLYQEQINRAQKEVEKGYPLSLVLSQSPLFPPILTQMIKVGEETGKIDETLTRVSNYFETTSEQTIKGLTTAIEPLIMVLLGLGVGFLVIAVIMPIYNLTSSIQ